MNKKILKFIFINIALLFILGSYIMIFLHLKGDNLSSFYLKYYPKDDPLFSSYHPKLTIKDGFKFRSDAESVEYQKNLEDFIYNVKNGVFQKDELLKLDVEELAVVLKNVHKNLKLKGKKLSDDKFIQTIIDVFPKDDKQYLEYHVFIEDVPLLYYHGHKPGMSGKWGHELLKEHKNKFFKNNNVDYTDKDLQNFNDMCSLIKFYYYFANRPSMILKKTTNFKKIKYNNVNKCSDYINKLKPYLTKSIIEDFILFFKNGGLDYYRYSHGDSGIIYVMSKGLSADKASEFRVLRGSEMYSRSENMILRGYIALSKDVNRYLNVVVILESIMGRDFFGYFH